MASFQRMRLIPEYEYVRLQSASDKPRAVDLGDTTHLTLNLDKNLANILADSSRPIAERVRLFEQHFLRQLLNRKQDEEQKESPPSPRPPSPVADAASQPPPPPPPKKIRKDASTATPARVSPERDINSSKKDRDILRSSQQLSAPSTSTSDILRQQLPGPSTSNISQPEPVSATDDGETEEEEETFEDARAQSVCTPTSELS